MAMIRLDSEEHPAAIVRAAVPLFAPGRALQPAAD
jgi:hypothetical protein